MAKSTKALSGPAKRKYFRDVLAADPGVTPDAAKRLVDRFDADLTHMRVRGHVSLQAPVEPEASPVKPKRKPVAPQRAAAVVFDPHAFSLIVVMTKQGAEGLLRRLKDIDDVGQLRELARAQHIAVATDIAEADTLRAAIVKGTAERIANRRAAAS